MKSKYSIIKKLIFSIFIALILLVLIFFIVLKIASMPTPDFLRNSSANGVTIRLIKPNKPKPAIIKTYKMQKYEDFSNQTKEKIDNKTAGGVEGDIPCLDLLKDKNIYLEFIKDDEVILPDGTPKIEIITSKSYYDDPNDQRVIKDEVTKVDENKLYSYTTDRYMTQFEAYILEYSLVKIYYTIDKEDYVSIFSIYKSNVEDGTDYFDNYILEKAIPAEV